MAAFSRLQLAAALIEYDNDPSNPDVPFRSAHDSAIFAHLRRASGLQSAARKSTDYLGVALPSEAGSGSGGGRESTALDNIRKSRASMDGLRNPFGAAEEEHEETEEEHQHDMDLDLSSWGLDAFLKKEKGEKGAKKPGPKTRSEVLPNPHPVKLEGDNNGEGPSRRPQLGSRSMSMSGLDNFGEGGAFLDPRSNPPRRASYGTPLDIPERHTDSPRPTHERAKSHHALIANMPGTPPLYSVPFPSKSPAPSEILALGSTDELNNVPRAGSPDRHSQFLNRISQGFEENTFAVRPPSPSRTSRFDPKAMAHQRTMSNASWGTQALLNDAVSIAPSGMDRNHERRYSKWDLMRPKVLVMPSPLQGTMPMKQPDPGLRSKEGFELSTDGRPLPPGARAARRASPMPIASNSFTPNPRMSLSLSQLTFRNTLMVDGQRDVAYADIEENLTRATEEGQQIALPTPIFEEPELPVPVITEPEPQSNKPRRAAGKLYGKSLIDDLESRKAEMRSKQRYVTLIIWMAFADYWLGSVFTGDERPSMMARGSLHRSSTLIDPADLQRPTSQRVNSFHSQPALQRRNSVGSQPLLNFDDDDRKLGQGPALDARMPKSRSVFGVDTLWEREMAKLRQIQEVERAAAEERMKREEAEEAKNKKKRKGKGKGKGKAVETPEASPSPAPEETMPRTSAEPPVLPDIPSTRVRRGPPLVDDDDEAESESDSGSEPGHAPMRKSSSARGDNNGWASDEETGPIRTTGTGPRYRPRKASHPEKFEMKVDDESDEDIPLAATLRRATTQPSASDSEEDEPLSKLLTKSFMGSSASSLKPSSAVSPIRDEDEDDKPLGLRASVIPPSLRLPSFTGNKGDDDDERPLAFHPEQQRKTQYTMLAQQQQMMMQMTGSMFFTPPMMAPGYFGPPMPQMVMPPMQMATPPPAPMHDAAKLNRVDKWRHDVAVEGPE
ncbi:hypothetical protein NEOLEDRAFT_1242452 [Neolentinus lepideus HHB14362 ss-1]|uniref:Uncharacterized protein n=1 Tax=Neolentinus lepideus HHB14362 ss-1 TaxID=1314782 RepID=A0A165S0V8_9AGAM|nr:hypothetical protein NEOLEDRAFT_1242452 [Neolentinus lepideus HHB14362 ss-1]